MDPRFRPFLPDMVRPGRREGNRRLPSRSEMEKRGTGLLGEEDRTRALFQQMAG